MGVAHVLLQVTCILSFPHAMRPTTMPLMEQPRRQPTAAPAIETLVEAGALPTIMAAPAVIFPPAVAFCGESRRLAVLGTLRNGSHGLALLDGPTPHPVAGAEWSLQAANTLPKEAVVTAGVAVAPAVGDELIVIAYSSGGSSESRLVAMRLDSQCHLHLPTTEPLLLPSDAPVASLSYTNGTIVALLRSGLRALVTIGLDGDELKVLSQDAAAAHTNCSAFHALVDTDAAGLVVICSLTDDGAPQAALVSTSPHAASEAVNLQLRSPVVGAASIDADGDGIDEVVVVGRDSSLCVLKVAGAGLSLAACGSRQDATHPDGWASVTAATLSSGGHGRSELRVPSQHPWTADSQPGVVARQLIALRAPQTHGCASCPASTPFMSGSARFGYLCCSIDWPDGHHCHPAGYPPSRVCCLAPGEKDGCNGIPACMNRTVGPADVCHTSAFASVLVYGNPLQWLPRRRGLSNLRMQQDTPPTNGTGLDLDKLVAMLRATHSNTYEFAVCDPPDPSGVSRRFSSA